MDWIADKIPHQFLRRGLFKLATFWPLFLITLILPPAITWLYSNWYGVDTTSYFKVAEYYASLDFNKAVNGYWSPLVSWLLIPFVWLGVDLMIAFRVVCLILLYTVLIYVCSRFIKFRQIDDARFNVVGGSRKDLLVTKLRRLTYSVVYFALVVTLSVWCADSNTPDFISGIIAFWALYWSVKLTRQPDLKSAVILGVFLALLYFAKSFGFYLSGLILATLAVVTLTNSKQRLESLKPVLVSTVVFIFISLSWMLLIYLKYETFTISTASKVNINLIGPDTGGHHIERVNYIAEPTYGDSYTAWYDPTYIPPKSWSLEGNVYYYLNHVMGNARYLISSLLSLSPLLLLALYFRIRYFLSNKAVSVRFLDVFLLLGLISTIWGYSLVFAAERYLYIIVVPIVIFGVLQLFRGINNQKIHQLILISCISLFAIWVDIKKMSDDYMGAMYSHGMKSVYEEVDSFLPNGARVALQSIDLMPLCYNAKLQCVGINFKVDSSAYSDEIMSEKLVKSSTEYYITRSSTERPDLELTGRYVGKSFMCISPNMYTYECPSAVVYVYKINSL